MPNAAVSASAGAGVSGGGGGGGGNPFQTVTNLYAEKNNQGSITQLLDASTHSFGGPINSGNYLRGLRLLVRTTVAGVTPGTVAPDGPFGVLQNISLTNVDGSEILYNMGGYARYLISAYFRPWEINPVDGSDFSSTVTSPSFTLFLKPEVRWTLGVLANTDTRSQYRFDANLGPSTTLAASFATAPTISVTPYMDAWAQPDAQDLQGTPNQPVPPGVNLQIKQRHQVFSGLSGAGGDNTLLSTLTGNALRGAMWIFRDGSNVRQDGFSDPMQLTLDNRSLGKFTPDILFEWMDDFYQSAASLPPTGQSRPVGVYVYPRFLLPGQLYGQGWLYTSNATKFQLETATAAGITGTPSVELITDEVYPVGPVDPVLVDI